MPRSALTRHRRGIVLRTFYVGETVRMHGDAVAFQQLFGNASGWVLERVCLTGLDARRCCGIPAVVWAYAGTRLRDWSGCTAMLWHSSRCSGGLERVCVTGPDAWRCCGIPAAVRAYAGTRLRDRSGCTAMPCKRWPRHAASLR